MKYQDIKKLQNEPFRFKIYLLKLLTINEKNKSQCFDLQK